MLYPFLTGFFLGISLIIAIGAQNAFVLKQGIIGKHIFYVSLFCAIADSLLISLGVLGISIFFDFIYEFQNLLFGLSSIWLFCYGLLSLKSAIINDITFEISNAKTKSLSSTIYILAILTFANPHVYLDTMILIGSISQQFSGINKVSFALGASIASFIFFFSLGFGANKLKFIMNKPNSWRILNSLVAAIMFLIALNLASEINWI